MSTFLYVLIRLVLERGPESYQKRIHASQQKGGFSINGWSTAAFNAAIRNFFWKVLQSNGKGDGNRALQHHITAPSTGIVLVFAGAGRIVHGLGS